MKSPASWRPAWPVWTKWSWAPPTSSHLAVTRQHTESLAVTLNRPTRYRQRCLEQVSLLPTGGQRWQRTVQTQVPKSPEAEGRDWRIVSLGEFEPWRFPDFTVTDAAGVQLNRLTRRQHGVALTKAVLALHFFRLPTEQRNHFQDDAGTRYVYKQLRESLRATFTAISVADSYLPTVEAATRLFAELLIGAGFPKDTAEQRDELTKKVTAFAFDLAENLTVIQYLCWVNAAPGEILNLHASWTVRDPLGGLISRGRLRPALKAIRVGLLTLNKTARRKAWMRWYCQFGLAPMPYRFRTPKTGSYYFTIEPPDKTDITYLDWEVSNSFEDSELNSGVASAHFHDRDTTRHKVRRRAVRAYVRCRTREHKQVAAGGLLNAVFVVLVARGQLAKSVGTTSQAWLLVTPTILIAYLAEQQRHYYAHTTRRQRGILWVYLVVSISFLVAISASSEHGTMGSQHWNDFLTVLAWIFFAMSVAVFVWYTPLGYNYQLTTENGTKKRFAQKRDGGSKRWKVGRWRIYSEADPRETWEIYEDTVRRYCNRVFRGMLFITPCALAALILTWQHPPVQRRVPLKVASRIEVHGTLTTTAWPSSACKGQDCNVEFRFVPAGPQSK
jgi:hypothetical protein